jgi:hypothetical protein
MDREKPKDLEKKNNLSSATSCTTNPMFSLEVIYRMAGSD